MDKFDAVILTMPVPQIVNLSGMNSILSNDLKNKLSKVEYSSRYALALFFDKFEENVMLSNDPKVGAEYISDDSIFCYAATNGLKRGLETEFQKVPTSVIFHTKVPWGIKHLDMPLPEVEKVILLP